MFRKKDSNTTLYLYHFHRRLYNMVTKKILLVITKEKDLQKRTTLPFSTLSPYYQLLKDQKFLEGLQTLLKECKRIMRSKSPSPVFIPSPGPSGGTEGPITVAIPEPPSSAPITAPPPHVRPIPVIRQYIHPSSSLLKEDIPLPPVVPRVPSPPLADPSPFIQTLIHSPPVEPPRVTSPPLPLVPWGSHRRQYSSIEQYGPPVPMSKTPNPVNISLPQSLTPSPPTRRATPVIPAPWNRSPTPEEIPLPPSRPSVKKHIGPSSLDLIPLPWDIPPFKGITPQLSPPVASSSFLPEEPMPLPVELPPEFPLIVSMTPSHTTPLLPKNPLTESEPLSNRPTPPEWKRVQSLPVTGKRKELSPETESSPPVASSS